MNAVERWAGNPFFVLELAVTASRAEVERAGQKWLAMLELGLARAAIYTTPLGVRARTPELVRSAMAELRDPERRAGHEPWCLLQEPASVIDPPESTASEGEPGFDAMGPLQWSRR